MYKCIFIILAVAACSVKMKEPEKPKLNKRFETMRKCDDFPNGKMKFENLKIEQIGRNLMSVSGELDMEIPLTTDFTMKVQLNSCPSKAQRPMCQDYPAETIDNVCEKLNKKDQVWSHLIQSMNVSNPHCPVPAGKYKFSRYDIDLDELGRLPDEEGYWTVTFTGYENNKKVMCEISEFNIVTSKH